MEYRAELESAYRKTCDDYDKALLALSGGAIGLSMAFIKDIVRTEPIRASCLLVSAWISWAASLALVITCFYFSRLAIQHAINRAVEGKESEGPRSTLSIITEVLAAMSGVAFLLGVGLIIG